MITKKWGKIFSLHPYKTLISSKNFDLKNKWWSKRPPGKRFKECTEGR